MRPHIQTLAKPAASASNKYITSIAVSSAPLDAGDRKPATAMTQLLATGSSGSFVQVSSDRAQARGLASALVSSQGGGPCYTAPSSTWNALRECHRLRLGN